MGKTEYRNGGWWGVPLRILALGVLLAALAGCVGVEAKMLGSTLEDTLNKYNQLMRWGNYEEAAAYLRPRAGKMPPPSPALRQAQGERGASAAAPGPEGAQAEALTANIGIPRGVRITDYQSSPMVMNQKSREALVVARGDYYLENGTVLRHFEEKQTWWFDDGKKTGLASGWFLDGAPVHLLTGPRTYNRVQDGIHLTP